MGSATYERFSGEFFLSVQDAWRTAGLHASSWTASGTRAAPPAEVARRACKVCGRSGPVNIRNADGATSVCDQVADFYTLVVKELLANIYKEA